MKKREKEPKAEQKTEALDRALFAQLQPKGGVSFAGSNHVLMGDGYVRCLHVYTLPSALWRFWLSRLTGAASCIVSIDISSRDMAEAKKNINKSISEENARAVVARDYVELYDAQRRKSELQLLFDELSRMGEVLKVCDIRIFVKSRTKAELESRCAELQRGLEADGYLVTTLLNEQKAEWQSLWMPSRKQHNRPMSMKGLTLTTEQLAVGDPFDHCELLDSAGTLLGFSRGGGAVVFDEFAATKNRKHNNSIVCGEMGSGKSTLLKKRFKANASIGNYIRCFDVSGEFEDLTLAFGGKIIRCNGGADGMLNPMEILQTGDDEYISYANHIAKLQSFFQSLVPSMDDRLRQELAGMLRRFYEAYELTPDDDNLITGLEPTEYPILSDFGRYLASVIEEIKALDAAAQTEVEHQLNVDKARSFQTILSAVDNLCHNYGRLFDGHSSIQDITSEKIVTFDISAIKGLGNIFAAEMQLLTALCWDNAVSHGKKSLAAWEAGTAREDIDMFLLIIDESHIWVNTRMPLILDGIIAYMRQARKYFAGITLASQSVRDFLPEETAEGMERVRLLFELSQYKFLFKQDSAAKEYLRRIFGGNLTESQVERIPLLGEGDCILSISGDRALQFKVWLSEEYEKPVFGGGR